MPRRFPKSCAQIYGTLALSGFGIEAVSSVTAAKEEMMGTNSASMDCRHGGGSMLSGGHWGWDVS